MSTGRPKYSVAGLPRDGVTAPCREGRHEECTRERGLSGELVARAADGWWTLCGCGCHYSGSSA